MERGRVGKMLDKKKLDENFKKYDYNGFCIYKIHASGYCVYDEKTNEIIIIETTLKAIKAVLDKWTEQRSKNGSI